MIRFFRNFIKAKNLINKLINNKNERIMFFSTTKLYHQSKIKRKFSENIHQALCVFYLLFIGLYFCVPPVTEPATDSIKDFFNNTFITFGFSGFSDVTIKYIITTTTNLLVTVLTILSAVYVFTHREQKAISPSLYNETKKNGLVIFVVIVLVFTMITGHTLASNIESFLQQDNYHTFHPLHASKVLIYKIGIWVVGIALTLLLVIELIRYLFISMNTDKMLKSSIDLVSDYVDLLTMFYRSERFNSLLTERYKFIHHSVESIFQYLKFLGDNNMNKDFDENIDLFSEVIDKLKKPHSSLSIENVSSYLLEKDKELFLGIYNSLLRNTLSLLLHLYKNNHFNKGKKLTDLYFSLYLDGENSLKQHFALSLNEFLDSLDTSNERQVKNFLSGLRKLPEESTLIIYKNLMQKLIIKGNIGLLTTVVYDFKEHLIKENINEQPKEKSNPIFEAIAAQNQIKMKINAIIILLQLLVKSIEISQYGTAGFLVKYMITNFKGKDINGAYQKLKQNPTSFTSILETTDDNVNIDEENEISLVGLNKETIDYCCKKMQILLYGQQQFVLKEKLWFISDNDNFKEPIDIEAEFKNCPYTNYVLKKVQSASTKYGLLFFNDKELLKNIYQKLNVEHHYPNNEETSVKHPQHT
ncbi:hypothetical protein [Metabacillus litoralis]|uniref:hypothetical protein n=1 Tax=Metabacillus litoralis TaxID=152268 RepID=UPI00203AE7BE|nr:hypothetical protein [Metabacillus litoralis]MCM3412671.1 hypothetical protein [Metabacillus litoralis]